VPRAGQGGCPHDGGLPVAGHFNGREGGGGCDARQGGQPGAPDAGTSSPSGAGRREVIQGRRPCAAGWSR
jgi:hypothetical protein